MWHQIIPLSGEKSPAERTPLLLFTQLPVRRLKFASANSAWWIFSI